MYYMASGLPRSGDLSYELMVSQDSATRRYAAGPPNITD